jgi:uncharacterized membrane protein (DUF485 family)
MTVLPKFWQRHFLLMEAAMAVALSLAFTTWYFQFNGAKATCEVLMGNRAAIYGAVASIFGSLLGFVITATSVVLGFSTSDKLAVVRDSSEYPKLWKTFSSTIWTLALTTLVALVCLLFDKDAKSTPWLVVPLVFTLLLSLLRIARTIWALEHIIGLVTRK